MKELIPENAPIEGEEWSAIFPDVERVIMPGVCTTWSNFPVFVNVANDYLSSRWSIGKAHTCMLIFPP